MEIWNIIDPREGFRKKTGLRFSARRRVKL
jgi:hypothetical protein